MMIKTLVAGALALLAMVDAQAQVFGATKPIWVQRSMYRNIIVLDGPTHRCLTFGRRSARQSCVKKDAPATNLVFGYTQRMFDALQYVPNVKRVLVVGIGGGSIPMAIREKYPDVMVDAVELDQEVINVAERFFNFNPNNELLRVFAEDGRVHIRRAIREGVKFDVVMLDAFDKDYIPEHMATAEFLMQVKSALTPNGILMSNTYKKTGFAKYEEATYQHVFGSVYESAIPNGNRIIFAGKHAADVASHLPDSARIDESDATVMRDRFSPVNSLLVR